jgi:8-oxo-dGTP pyrophosphatase MutT (NUDIX family)
MREMQVVMCLLEKEDQYLLQRRTSDKRRGGAGLIGCFGGKIESGETSIQALCREISEETNLQPNIGEILELGEVDVISDNNLEEVKVHIQVYHWLLKEAHDVMAQEGELVMFNEDEARANLDNMTPGTRACFKELVFKEK